MIVARSLLNSFLKLQYRLAQEGLAGETVGVEKLAKAERLEREVRDQLGRSSIGACHREKLAVLSLDVRGSSKIAEERTREDVFTAFHCLLPMAALILRLGGGEVAGLRGDGVLGVVGIGEESIRKMVRGAYETGMVLIEATRDVLNPFLDDMEVPVKFSVGVGLDWGLVTLTKIGFQSDFEITAYGTAVNTAAKHSDGVNSLWASDAARTYLPWMNDSASIKPAKRRISDLV